MTPPSQRPFLVVAFCLLLAAPPFPASAAGDDAPLPPGAAAPNAGMEARFQGLEARHFSREPKIREVQEDAVRYATAEPERARSWFRRANWANLAPRRVKIQLDRDNLDNKQATSRDRVELSARTDVDNNYLWQFLAEWDFSRLIFNPDIVRTATQAIDLAELREDVLNATTKIYFERRAVQMELILDPPSDFRAFAKKRLRLEELTADLDALTGGAFSHRLKARSGSRLTPARIRHAPQKALPATTEKPAGSKKP